MAALIVYGRSVGASLMTRQLWTWAIAMALMGFLMSGVDNMAHIGGFAGGYLAASLFQPGLGRSEGRGSKLLAFALLLMTLLGFGSSLAITLLRFAS